MSGVSWTLFFGITVAALCGCTPSSPVSALPVLHAQLPYEPISLDPGLAEDGVSLQVLDNIHEGLVGYDGEGKLQNRIAESYTLSPDRKRYEFTLRKEARWSDGQPVRAEDFVTAFQRMLAPDSKCKLAPLFFPIRGSRKGELGVTARQGKLVIELDRPISYFVHALTLPSVFPIRKDILEANHGIWPDSAPVTGPYRIVQHQMDQKIILGRNPLYWFSQCERAPLYLFGRNQGSPGRDHCIKSFPAR